MNQMRDAFQKAAIDLGGALLVRGGEPLVVDAGTFEAEPPVQPVVKVDPVEQKVMAFLRVCRTTTGLTVREVSGGTGIPVADVRRALESLVTVGEVHHDDAPEQNYRRYRLSGSAPAAPPTPGNRGLFSFFMHDLWPRKNKSLACECIYVLPAPAFASFRTRPRWGLHP